MAKNLMIQGTMSNAGKSILTAGILRVLRQDGYRGIKFLYYQGRAGNGAGPGNAGGGGGH